MASRTLPLPCWHVVIEQDVSAVQLPDGVDPGLIRVAAAGDIRGGDLVVGTVDGPLNGRNNLWGTSPNPRVFYALPVVRTRHPGLITLDGFGFYANRSDEVLYVPAVWCPVAYGPGVRVERIGGVIGTRPGEGMRKFLQRGTVVQGDDGDGTLTVQWDGDSRVFRTSRDLIRPVDPAVVAEERTLYGCAAGDRVTADGGPSGLVLELRRNSLYGPVVARVLWDSTAFRAGYEEFRPVAELRAEPIPGA